MMTPEKPTYEAVPSGSQTFVLERPSGRTFCMCPAPEANAKAAVIVRALNSGLKTPSAAGSGEGATKPLSDPAAEVKS